MKLITLLFIVVIGYLVYNLIKFVLYLGKSSRANREKMENLRNRQQQANRGNSNKIIELDKDQYHVD